MKVAHTNYIDLQRLYGDGTIYKDKLESMKHADVPLSELEGSMMIIRAAERYIKLMELGPYKLIDTTSDNFLWDPVADHLYIIEEDDSNYVKIDEDISVPSKVIINCDNNKLQLGCQLNDRMIKFRSSWFRAFDYVNTTIKKKPIIMRRPTVKPTVKQSALKQPIARQMVTQRPIIDDAKQIVPEAPSRHRRVPSQQLVEPVPKVAYPHIIK
jgi:hypothetical protein